MPLTGCSTYRAYPGPRRAPGEVTRLTVPLSDRLVIDHQFVEQENVNRIEFLPGEHVIEWKYIYPNRHEEMKRLSFTAEPGRRYKLGQQFFPAPLEGGPLEAVLNFALDVTVTPLIWLFPPEAPADPSPGDYFMWIIDQNDDQVLAGMTPDVPPSFSAITYVPIEEP